MRLEPVWWFFENVRIIILFCQVSYLVEAEREPVGAVLIAVWNVFRAVDKHEVLLLVDEDVDLEPVSGLAFVPIHLGRVGLQRLKNF